MNKTHEVLPMREEKYRLIRIKCVCGNKVESSHLRVTKSHGKIDRTKFPLKIFCGKCFREYECEDEENISCIGIRCPNCDIGVAALSRISDVDIEIRIDEDISGSFCTNCKDKTVRKLNKLINELQEKLDEAKMAKEKLLK